jgi:cell division protein FtsN
MGKGGALTSMPIASFQTGNGFYAEGRYNYEALNSFSFYMGRTFSKESALSYSISPIAGAVMGDYNGGSFGVNISLGYKNFYFFSQPQYTFSLAGAYDNYIYSWTDLTYSPLNWLSVGVSLQHTKPYQAKSYMENGFVVEAAYKKFTFPIYIFSPLTSGRTFVFGANFELNFKKNKSKPRSDSDSFKEVYPVNIIAEVPEKPTVEPVREVVKPPVETIVKVRRVNVIVHTQEANNPPVGALKAAKLQPEKTVQRNVAAVKQIPTKQPTAIKNVNGNEKNIPASAGKAEELVALKNKPTDIPKQTVLLPVASSVQFALLLGPFKNEEEALNVKSKLTEVFEREISIYTEGGKFKLRISGFKQEEEAELFARNASIEGFNAESSIISYKLKSIDPIPLKNVSKPFEATRL